MTCLQFSGSRIVSGSDDNTLRIWNAITGRVGYHSCLPIINSILSRILLSACLFLITESSMGVGGGEGLDVLQFV